MKIIIIEDEKPAARLLQRKIEKLGYSVQQMLHSVQEAVLYFQNNTHPDLIFLDIQLSDGLSFEIFEQLDIQSAIIFTTAYDQYALKAFKMNSIDYLLKPIDEEELQVAMQKMIHQQQAKLTSLDIDAIKQLLIHPVAKSFKKRFTIKVGNQLKIIDIEDVVCFFSENKATYLHTADNRSYLIESTLELLEQDLDTNQFFRINRKWIVALKAVQEIQLYSNSRLKIIIPAYKNEDLIVAREKVSDFKQWIS